MLKRSKVDFLQNFMRYEKTAMVQRAFSELIQCFARSRIFLFLLFIFIQVFSTPSYALQTTTVLPPLVRVGLESEFFNLSRLNIGNKHLTVGYNMNGSFSPLEAVQSAEGFIVTAEPGKMVLYAGNQAVLTLDDSTYAIQIRDGGGGFVLLNGKPYMNTVELYRPSKVNINCVNVLTPQEYLYSVVPSEMPVEYQAEALKAQAVAARNYLLTRMGIHSETGYDMCDRGHCMAYKGAVNNHEAGKLAVDSTAGQMIYYQGQPINAVFFSSSGGVTDNAENVWNEAVPYLRSVPDTNEFEPRVWTRSFTWGELTNLLVANSISIGTANDAAITKRGAGGRVLELTIYATTGQKSLSKEEIRTFFTPSAGGTLESRNFNLSGGSTVYTNLSVTDGLTVRAAELNSVFVYNAGQSPSLVTVQPSVLNAGQAIIGQTVVNTLPQSGLSATGITVTGTGWGHGVGMSQRGAEGLARMGYTYRDILKHYYTGVDIY